MNEVALDFSNISFDELQEGYLQLLERYQQLSETSEGDAQRIHDLKRNLDTAVAAERFLVQELEQLTAATPNATTQEAAHNKLQNELDELRRKHHIIINDQTTLQAEYDSLFEENAELQKELQKALLAQNDKNATAGRETPTSEQMERLFVLENENLELLHQLETYNEKTVQHTMALAERDRNIEIMRDQVNCLEENMRCKREELDEKTQLFESTQEQLLEANAKIAMLTTAPENADRKGNSLFAEVDDQRQAMRQLLAAQKRSYLQMKKTFLESEHEIRRLKRENIAMHTELRTCSSIFCKADKTYQDKLNERIRHLNTEKEELERKLKWTEERLNELATGKGVLWLDSMFNFCKNETDDLKKQLHSVRIQKASLEQQLWSSEQDLARWRFESLKSRCLLIEREHLLSENQISFKPINDIEYHITERQLQAARPRIVSVEIANDACATVNAIINDVEVLQIKQDILNEKNAALAKLCNETATQPQTSYNAITDATIAQSETLANKENIVANNVTTETELEPTDAGAVLSCQNSVLSESNKQALQVKSFANISKLDLIAAPTPPRPTRPSILMKTRNLLLEEPQKNVHFSTNAPIIHNLSSIDDSLVSDNSVIECTASTTSSNSNSSSNIQVQSSKASNKQIRSKSNIVIRRIVVGSKQGNK